MLSFGRRDCVARHCVTRHARYPLAVKLGTITPNGADVYSYAPDEDNMIKVSFQLRAYTREMAQRANRPSDFGQLYYYSIS